MVRFTAILGASGEVTKLFSVDDYTSAQATDQKMVEIYKALSGTAAKPDPLNTEGFQICDEGYLLRYDRGVGQWATVVPTKKADQRQEGRRHGRIRHGRSTSAAKCHRAFQQPTWRWPPPTRANSRFRERFLDCRW